MEGELAPPAIGVDQSFAIIAPLKVDEDPRSHPHDVASLPDDCDLSLVHCTLVLFGEEVVDRSMEWTPARAPAPNALMITGLPG